MSSDTLHTFEMTEAQAKLVFGLVSAEIGAIKNWMSNAIERGEVDRASKLVGDLRQYEALFAQFNIDVKHAIADAAGVELVTLHPRRYPRNQTNTATLNRD